MGVYDVLVVIGMVSAGLAIGAAIAMAAIAWHLRRRAQKDEETFYAADLDRLLQQYREQAEQQAERAHQ